MAWFFKRCAELLAKLVWFFKHCVELLVLGVQSLEVSTIVAGVVPALFSLSARVEMG